jgi:hypothetical protein
LYVLGPSGCVLPQTVRPLICRLFPITYTEKGIDGEDDFCPRAVVAPESESMIAVARPALRGASRRKPVKMSELAEVR